ncbi:hypothetical protein [Actinoallomurus iriomotensis]|uniref:Uncharacterized protein n=1 Tax=Actinoallomurus iriomotensis TaxID=478107 RepID=A0A9W6VWR6_9ACTN|nr:hypothetical protein [Actinoallomurus iriomotensis]GLY81862.1 hypothetical protein Airi01_101290 [Actinoallomurus iriomotensis]
MQIEVKVGDVDLSTAIRGYYGPNDEPATLADLVVTELASRFMQTDDWSTLRRRIREIRDEEIRAQITPMIAETIAKPIQRTVAYGDPIGEPISMREVVVDEARKILQGTPKGSYDRNAQPLGRQLIHEMVSRELKTELADAIKAERQKVVDAVRAQAAELITEAVTKGVTGR